MKTNIEATNKIVERSKEELINRIGEMISATSLAEVTEMMEFVLNVFFESEQFKNTDPKFISQYMSVYTFFVSRYAAVEREYQQLLNDKKRLG
jgi:hypothetical protein